MPGAHSPGEPEQSVMINPGWSAEARNSASALSSPRAGVVSFGHSPFQDRLRLALKQNLMGSADREPTFGLVPGRPRHVYLQGRPQLAPPSWGRFFLEGM